MTAKLNPNKKGNQQDDWFVGFELEEVGRKDSFNDDMEGTIGFGLASNSST